MSNFPIVATVLSMILGLSVTRLLLGVLTVFRIRRVAKPDWVALVWAVMLFTMQLQFWWAVNALSAVKQTFSFLEFLLLVMLTLSLFVTAALLLPSRSEDEQNGLRVYFEQDGRYADFPRNLTMRPRKRKWGRRYFQTITPSPFFFATK
jgi:hypothetical protein